MFNTTGNGFKHGFSKNIFDLVPTTGTGSGFNTINNTGAGIPILSDGGGGVLNSKTFIAGNGIDIIDSGSTLTISSEPNTQVLPFQFDQKTLYVSQTHPNADQPGSRIFSTIQAAITYNADTEGIIQIAPGNYPEALTITRTAQLGFICQSIAQVISINILYNAATVVYFNGNQGKFIVDNVLINATVPGAIFDADNMQAGTSFTDNSAGANTIITILRNSQITNPTIQVLYESIDNTFSGNMDIQQSINKCNDCIFSCNTVNINSYLTPTSGFRDCSFDTSSGTYSSSSNTIQLDSNSYYSFDANTWNISGCSIIQLELLDLTNNIYGLLGTNHGGTGIFTYNTGDVIYCDTPNHLTRLPIGANGNILNINSGLPAWANPTTSLVTSFSALSTGLTPNVPTTGAVTLGGVLNATHGGTGNNSVNTGDILVGSGVNIYSLLNPGTVGQVLTISGGSPTWQNPGASVVSSFSAGTTGFTPNVATTGAIVLNGTLNETHGGTNQTTYSTGDILYCSAPNTLSKLPVGIVGQLLKVSPGGLPIWSSSLPAIDTITGASGTVSTTESNPYGTPITALWTQNNNGLIINYDNLGRVTQVSEVLKYNLINPSGGFVYRALFSDPDLIYPPNLGGDSMLHYFEVRVILCRDSVLTNSQTINFSFVVHQTSSNVKTIQPDSNSPAYTYRTIPKFNPNYTTYFDQLVLASNYIIYDLTFDNGPGVPILNGNIGFYVDISDGFNYNVVFQTNKYTIYN